MKPKRHRAGNAKESQPYDRCQTPAYALDPLLAYICSDWPLWEPAAGEGNLSGRLVSEGYQVYASDVLTDGIGDAVIGGKDFFTWQPPFWHCLVTNPPYSIKPQWIARCYNLGKPFALLVPVETIGAQGVQRLMERYGAELLLLDKRVNFKMPNLRSWEDSNAQFPTLWYCWQILPAPIMYGRIARRHNQQLILWSERAAA